LAAQDPFDTRTALALMSALDAAGNRPEALQHASIYNSLLKDELGAEPDPAIQELAERIRSTSPSPRLPTPQPTDETEGRRTPPIDASPSPETGGPRRPLIARAAEGRFFQWTLTYVAGAWFVLQAMDVLSEPWDLSRKTQRGVVGLLALGFPVAMALAWYRAQRKAQTVRGYTTLVLAVVLGTLGTGLAVLTGPGQDPVPIQGGILRGSYGEASGTRPLPSIAVLPFDNISPNPQDAYLAAGLHEELITQLSKISGLIVISRNSVMGFRDHEGLVSEIARELNVDAILEGSVQKAGDQIRFTAQLIDGGTDAHLWGDRYDRTLSMENLFDVQTEVSLRVAERLRATLTPGERERLARLPTGSLEAFNLYLQGRESYLRYQAQDNDRAIGYFRQAISLDPGFALAWAGVSNAYSQGVLGFGLDRSWADSALAAAQRSIDLAPNEAEGHKALGLAFTSVGSYRLALDAYMEALRFDPNHASATANVGVMLMRFGALDKSLLWTRRTLEVSPNHSLVRANMAWNYLSLEEWALAESWAGAIVVDAPEIVHGHEALAILATSRGDAAEGLRIAEAIIEVDPEAPARRQFAAEMALFARDWEKTERYSRQALSLTLGGGIPPWHLPETTLGVALLRNGREEEGREFLSEAKRAVTALLDSGSDDPRLAWEMGCILTGEGAEEEAVHWLERGFDAGWRWARVAELDPILDSLRPIPAFRSILSGMNESVAAMRQRAREDEEAAGLR
jgi:TolB-like protein